MPTVNGGRSPVAASCCIMVASADRRSAGHELPVCPARPGRETSGCSGLLDGYERSNIAGGGAAVRLGPNDAAYQRRDLINTVRPLVGQRRVIIVFPALGRRA